MVLRPLDLGTGAPSEILHCQALSHCSVITYTGPQRAPYVLRIAGQSLQGLPFTASVTCLGTCADPRWALGGTASIPQGATPGIYRGIVTLVLEGPDGAIRQNVPVTARVRASEPACTLSQDRVLHFGHGLASQPGELILNPVHGLRTLTGAQKASPPSPYQISAIHIATTLDHVLITVSAPSVLRSPTAAMRFTSLLASNHSLAITGSGSTTLTPDEQGTLRLRLGGRVSVTSNTPPGRYRGTIQIRYHCY